MKKEPKIGDLGLNAPFMKSIHNFGISAVVALVILIIGVIIGGHFIFGFGIFMLVIVGLLTSVAVIEYVLAIV